MPAIATSTAPIVVDGALVRDATGQTLRILDARPKMTWTEEEIAKSVETQQKKSGALVALVRERIEATWSEIRRELNEAAGGKASARVMVLAHHAMRAHQALELQTLLAEVAAGEHGEGKRADPNNGLRNQSGLSVIATQALNQAYEAARSEAGNRSSPTAQLMTRLGVGQPASEVPTLSPFGPPGGVAIGSPPSVLAAPEVLAGCTCGRPALPNRAHCSDACFRRSLSPAEVPGVPE